MRVPITGGSPELIFSARAESTLSCARAPHNLCAITEASEDHKQAIVKAFDPVEGRGQELFRFDLDLDSDRWFCEISPDGLRLAVSGGPEGPMRILSLRGQPAQLIRAKNLKNMWTLHWAADGKGLFVSSGWRYSTSFVSCGSARQHPGFVEGEQSSIKQYGFKLRR
jgi:hypothetical protein